MGGNSINITGNNNDTVVDSNVGSVAGVRAVHGEALAAALKEMATFVQAERNQFADAALKEMEAMLAKHGSPPEVAQSHWRRLVAALPTIMQLPATLTVIRSLFRE